MTRTHQEVEAKTNLVPLVFRSECWKVGPTTLTMVSLWHHLISRTVSCSSGEDCWNFPLWERAGDQTQRTRTAFGSKNMVVEFSQLCRRKLSMSMVH